VGDLRRKNLVHWTGEGEKEVNVRRAFAGRWHDKSDVR